MKPTGKNVKKESFDEVPRVHNFFHKYLENFWPLEAVSTGSAKKNIIQCHWRENIHLSLQPPKGEWKVKEKNRNEFCPLYVLLDSYWGRQILIYCNLPQKEGWRHRMTFYGFVWVVSVGGEPGCESWFATTVSGKPQGTLYYPFHVLPHLHLPAPKSAIISLARLTLPQPHARGIISYLWYYVL